MTFHYVAPSFVAHVLTGIADDLEVFGHDEGMRALVIARTRRFIEHELRNSRDHPPLAFDQLLGSLSSANLADTSEEPKERGVVCSS